LAGECRPWTPYPKPNLLKIIQEDINLLGKFIPKNTNFGGCKAHILEVRMVTFGIRVWAWDSLPMSNFVKIA